MRAEEDSPGVASLAGVLSLLETHGTAIVLARSLETLASPEVRAALHAEGVIVATHATPSWPCEVRGCSREVRANYNGAKKPLVAVCFQVPAVCSAVELGLDEVAQQQVSASALLVVVCRLLGAPLDRAALAKVREVRPLGEPRAPLLLAARDTPSRDVFWVGSPRDTDLGAWCARRERAAREALVLVPTAKHVSRDVAERFTRGDVVEVRALGDLIQVRDGKLALLQEGPRVEPLPERASSPPPAPIAPGLAALLGVTRWEEIRFTVADPTTLRIEANGKTLLRTFVELGFVDSRHREIVTPTTAWTLLVLFCKMKRLKPSAYAEEGNKPFGVKKAIERIGVAMRASFGLEAHPIHAYSKRSRLWEARFLIAQNGPELPPSVRAPRAKRRAAGAK